MSKPQPRGRISKGGWCGVDIMVALLIVIVAGIIALN